MLRSILTRAIRSTVTQNLTTNVSRTIETQLHNSARLCASNFDYLNFNSLISSRRSSIYCAPLVTGAQRSWNTFLTPRSSFVLPERTVTKFSLNKGKRKSVKAVIKRFKRLDWGGWIRTRTGRHKKLFKKSPALKRRLRQHVLVNSSQSWLLDKMVTKFWRRPKHYIDDPYEPYHKREEYFATRSKPIKY